MKNKPYLLGLFFILLFTISCSPSRNPDGTLKVVPTRFARLGNNLCRALEQDPRILKEAVKHVNLSPTNFKKFAQIYKTAPQGKSELDALAEKIVSNLNIQNAVVAKAPVKGLYRAMEKTSISYAGDASKLKDLIRNTIVTPHSKIPEIKRALVRANAVVSETLATADPLGYSGVNSKIRTSNGVWGEIQVNTPGMIFAKESEVNTRMILGNKAFEALREKLKGFTPGKGHDYYEKWRSPATDALAKKKIEAESKAYYDSIRNVLGENN